MNVYLDNAATTRVSEAAAQKALMLMREQYGNPSSLHYKGMESEREISRTRLILSGMLKVDLQEIYFTSGGTESNNLAVFGIARAYNRAGRHVITSSIEHPSVGAAVKQLQEEGFETTVVPVNSQGLVNVAALEAAIRPDTILVSIMHVNNEVGTIQPIDEIGKCIKRKNSKTIFHVDAVQSFGKLTILPKKWSVDVLSLSGHKFYAPKGVGALYLNSRVKIKPVIYGGSQQNGVRSGTENAPGIAALGVAAEFMASHMAANAAHFKAMRTQLIEGLTRKLEGVAINGLEGEGSAPYIVNLRFEGTRGEVLLHALEAKGIYVSTGSACSSNKPTPSETLKAMGLSYGDIDTSIRFSFSVDTMPEEIEYTIEQLCEIVPSLRRVRRK